MPSSDGTAAKAIVPRINSERKDYSANDEMMDAVRKWDEITLAFERGGLPGLEENVEWEGKKISAGQWSKKVFCPTRYVPTKKKYTETVGINYNSFRRYANDDPSKRAIITKQGRPKKTKAELAFAAVAQNAGIVDEQYYSRSLPSVLKDAANQNAMNRTRYDRALHEEMMGTFALTHRTDLQKQMWGKINPGRQQKFVFLLLTGSQLFTKTSQRRVWPLSGRYISSFHPQKSSTKRRCTFSFHAMLSTQI